MQRQKAHTWESGAVNPNKLHPRETSAEEAEPMYLLRIMANIPRNMLKFLAVNKS